jgi:peptidoglycan hydrolase-like protein with peptidoglycan-binding domain
MALESKLFADDEELQACLVSDAHHVVPGAQGEHVGRIQQALMILGAGVIALSEIGTELYGPSTARTVLTYKGPPRNILGPGQIVPDNIVGKKTIAALDRELVALEAGPGPGVSSIFVSLTPDGSPHDHSTCPVHGVHRVDHTGTPINPGPGRRINIGGTGETDYLGFLDVVTNTGVVGGPPRPLTDTIPDNTVTDIAVRSSPITPRGEQEIRRLAMSLARLTIATPSHPLPVMEQVIQRLGGTIIERFSLLDPEAADGFGLHIRVVILPPRP